MDVVIYHNADPDGNFSAAIVLKKYPLAQAIGYNYEPNMHNIINQCHGRRVVMVDVSPYDWKDMHRLCAVAKHVLWLDHHATALKQMQDSGVLELDNFGSHFEHGNWGACHRVWKYFYPDIAVPVAVFYVAAYDVYRDYGTDDWNNYFFPFRFAVDHLDTPEKVLENFDFENDNLEPWLTKGRAIVEYVDYQNARLVNNPTLCYETRFNPEPFSLLDNPESVQLYKVLAVNAGLHGDQFKSRDTSDYAFLVGFSCYVGRWKVSLRGTGKDIDLGQIAKRFGGGGHKNAAGFSVASFQELQKILMI